MGVIKDLLRFSDPIMAERERIEAAAAEGERIHEDPYPWSFRPGQAIRYEVTQKKGELPKPTSKWID